MYVQILRKNIPESFCPVTLEDNIGNSLGVTSRVTIKVFSVVTHGDTPKNLGNLDTWKIVGY